VNKLTQIKKHAEIQFLVYMFFFSGNLNKLNLKNLIFFSPVTKQANVWDKPAGVNQWMMQ